MRHHPGSPSSSCPGAESREPWASNPGLLARSPEPRAILYGALDEQDYASLVWLRHGQPPPAAVLDALERWRPVLGTRAEIVRNPRRAWWETLWPRDAEQMRAPKVIALYRTDRGRFALDEHGAWQSSIKTTIVTARRGGLTVAYLCGLLNSELLDLWYGVRGKTPRDVWRNYEPKPMARTPYRSVGQVGEPARGTPLGRLEAALAGGDALAAANLALELSERGSPEETAGAVALIVRGIAANRRALLPHRAVAPQLTRTVKDPWNTARPDLDLATMVGGRAVADRVSVRIDPELSVEAPPAGDPLGRPRLTDAGLVLRARRGEALSSVGRDRAAFDEAVASRCREIRALLDDGRLLVECVERLVCRLYGLPDELEEEVVGHAVDRGTRRRPGDE